MVQTKLQRRIAKKAQRYFATGVSMITSNGPLGKNVMAAEWTMQISYEPMLVAVFIHQSSASLQNIRKTKEFGVNVASDDQTTLVNIAGGYSRTEIDKLSIRGSFKFIKSKHIRSPMIKECVINAECQLVTTRKLGDHIMVVGRVVFIKHDKTKKPLIYHGSRYYKIGSQIEPFRQRLFADDTTFEWFSRESEGRFVLKCVGAVIKNGNKVLVTDHSRKNLSYETIPYVTPKAGTNYVETIENHLEKMGLDVLLKNEPILKRIILQNKNKVQRVNFILFEGKLRKKTSNKWKNIRKNHFLSMIAS